MTFKGGIYLALALAVPAFAQFAPVSSPTGAYIGGTTLIPITPPNGTSVGSVTNGSQTVSFSTNLTTATVPGGGWATWGSPPNTETATPRVVAIYTATTTFTMTLSVPSNTFGFEIEGDAFTTEIITATFMNGGTTLGSVTRTINGNAGALLAAASSGLPITSVVLTVPATANGFALAQFRYGNVLIGVPTVPTLGTAGVAGLGVLLAAAGALLARRQQLA